MVNTLGFLIWKYIGLIQNWKLPQEENFDKNQNLLLKETFD